MSIEALEKIFNDKISADTRPPQLQNLFTARAGGIKRTNIKRVRIVGAEEKGGATTLIQQTMITNGGNLVAGKFTNAPILPTQIHQGQLADCYLLASILAIIYVRPTFFNDIIIPFRYPDGTDGAILQFWYNGMIVQIETACLVSTWFNQDATGDIKIELLEKCYALLRSGVSDYTKDNYGTGTEAFSAFGLNFTSVVKLANLVGAALATGYVCVFITGSPTSGIDSTGTAWVNSHVYAVHAYNPGNQHLTVQNPWYGGSDIDVDPTLLYQPWLLAFYGGSFPNPPRLAAPAPALPAPVAIPASTPLPYVLKAENAVNLANCSLEKNVWSGVAADIGFVKAGASWESPDAVNLPAGNYALTMNVAINPYVSDGGTPFVEYTVSVGGIPITFTADAVRCNSSTGWGNFVPVVAKFSLQQPVAGKIQITSRTIGTNFQALTISQ